MRQRTQLALVAITTLAVASGGVATAVVLDDSASPEDALAFTAPDSSPSSAGAPGDSTSPTPAGSPSAETPTVSPSATTPTGGTTPTASTTPTGSPSGSADGTPGAGPSPTVAASGEPGPADPPAAGAPSSQPAQPAGAQPPGSAPAQPAGAPPVTQPMAGPPASISYTVQPGDTLSDIAAWFELNGFQDLYEANRAVIGNNPDLIRPGQVFSVVGGEMQLPQG